MSNYYHQLTKDIITIACDSEPDLEKVLNHYPVIKQLRVDSKVMKSLIDNLRNSVLKEAMRENYELFVSKYFDFVDGRTSQLFTVYIDGAPHKLSMPDIKIKFPKDPLFAEFPSLYGLLELKNLKEYNRYHQLVSFSKIMKDRNRYSLVCPYCQASHIEFNNLDHFLPKTTFPILSIFEENLIPICVFCNGRSIKGDVVPTIPIYHPYKFPKGILFEHVDFSFKGLNDSCDVIYDKSDSRVVNYINLFKIEERYRDRQFIMDFQTIWTSIIDTTKNNLRGTEPNSGTLFNISEVKEELNKTIRTKISFLKYGEATSYTKFKIRMLETVDAGLIENAIRQIYFTLNSGFIRKSTS